MDLVHTESYRNYEISLYILFVQVEIAYQKYL